MSGAGRVAVVTGAAQGIGQAVCVALAAHGTAIVGVDIADMTRTGELVSAAAPWLAVEADVSSPGDTRRMGEKVDARFGRCDILINNAGLDDPVGWDALDWERWRRVLAVNLDAMFLTAKALVDLMRRNRWGRIVNVASGMVLHPRPDHIAYRASKMGVIGYSRALAATLGDDGITVNVMSPGITQTAMAADGLDPLDITRNAQGRAIKRVAVPDDLVGTVLFLTSDDSAFVTGQTILVNGGAAFL